MDFEFIDESEIESVKRGRKSEVPAELVDTLTKALATGKAISLREYAGDPKSAGYKSYKAKVGSMLRQAGVLAKVKVRTNWSPSGVPQVRVSKSAPAKSK